MAFYTLAIQNTKPKSQAQAHNRFIYGSIIFFSSSIIFFRKKFSSFFFSSIDFLLASMHHRCIKNVEVFHTSLPCIDWHFIPFFRHSPQMEPIIYTTSHLSKSNAHLFKSQTKTADENCTNMRAKKRNQSLRNNTQYTQH